MLIVSIICNWVLLIYILKQDDKIGQLEDMLDALTESKKKIISGNDNILKFNPIEKGEIRND